MTDHAHEDDHAERIRRLQERRAAPSGARRRHPAAATRILLAGASVASFFTIDASVALADRATTPAAQPATAANAVASGQVDTSALPTSSAVNARAGQVTPVVPHAQTRGS